MPFNRSMTENKKYSRIQPVIPIGLGARIKVNPFFNILLEAGYRFTFTDYLDDASSTRYVDVALLKSDIARILFDRREGENKPSRPTQVGKRGNPAENDGYFITNVTLQYYLPVLLFENVYNKLLHTRRKAYYRKPRGR